MSSFDNFWNLYDNKKSRDKVERKWHLMSAKDQNACMDSLPSYILSTPDRQFRKHPITYLNQKCWNDKLYNKEGEGNLVVAWTKPKPLSNYKAPVPTEEERKAFIVGKIQQAYEGKIFLNDIGNVYTNRLEKFFETPDYILTNIAMEVKELSEIKPKNRFEEVVEISIPLEIRNRVLRYNIKVWQSESREIFREV